MFAGETEPADAGSPEELRGAYEKILARTIEEVGLDAVADRSGVATAMLEALADGRSPELTLAEAAAVLAADPARPTADAIAAEARDVLLMGMTTAVLDVESLASELDGDLGPTELQQKIEGRQPMTLAEFAAVRFLLASRSR